MWFENMLHAGFELEFSGLVTFSREKVDFSPRREPRRVPRREPRRFLLFGLGGNLGGLLELRVKPSHRQAICRMTQFSQANHPNL